MTVNELRIGNWINIQGNFKKVLGIDYLHKEHLIISDGYYQLDWCEPIPLTEEILLKCGFRMGKGKWGNTFSIMESNGYVCMFDVEHWTDTDVNSKYHNYWHTRGLLNGNKLKHLHQLQNLYFALTNQELNIEL